ncbi:MAG: MBL fold metallo-hydrolase [Ruminococcus sp.]|nr:MBL fold metallo-hydrolase [Ruminococcus sp.]
MAGKKQGQRPRQSAAEQVRELKRLEREVRLEAEAKKKRLRVILGILIVLAAAALIVLALIQKRRSYDTGETLEVHFIDVGQGDCAFITCGGEALLIDCGEEDAADSVIAYLHRLGVRRLDHVIATHPHSDHMGGMYKVMDIFDVGEAIIPHLADKDVPTARYFEEFLDSCAAEGVPLTEAEVGRVITLGAAEIEMIAPNSPEYDDLNDYSVSVLIRHGRDSFLLTGDAEETSEAEMVQGGRLTHVTVYKAGHHGSYSSSSDELLSVIKPEYAVISCGAGNSYGHPHASALRRIEAYTDRIYRTDECGTIVFQSGGDGVSVRTER